MGETRQRLKRGLDLALWGEIDARHVALIRILTMTVWLHDLVRMAPFVTLYYDPLVGSAEAWFAAWVLATVAVLIGFRARLFSVLGFVVSSVFVTLDHVIYHVDYYVLMTFFYFMFIETDRAWSVTSWLAARRKGRRRPMVWAGPVSMFSVHLALIYLNAGLAHLFFNRSWREGYALSQSFANPVWHSPAGEFVAHLGLPTWPLDYGTIAFELAFAPLWLYALLRPPARVLRIVLGLAAIAFHIAIAVFLNIGAFSHYVIATTVVFLPTSWLFRPPEDDAPHAGLEPALEARRRVALAFLGFFLCLAAIVQPPADLGAPETTVGRVLGAAGRTLALTGDVRPHDVFPEVVTERVFYLVAYFEGPARVEPWPLLFDERGERVGWGTDMRMFMSARLPLRVFDIDAVQDWPLSSVYADRLLELTVPLLERDLPLARNAWVERVRLVLRGYELGRRLADPWVAGPASSPLACFRVERQPRLGLVPVECA